MNYLFHVYYVFVRDVAGAVGVAARWPPGGAAHPRHSVRTRHGRRTEGDDRFAGNNFISLLVSS